MTRKPPAKNIAQQKSLDANSAAMIYEGVTITQIARIFHVDAKLVPGKIHAVKPAGERAGFPVYHIHEVAPYLVKPQGDIAAHIKRMNHRDLPPLLQREFWTGQRARLAFERDEGDLWPTAQVVEYIGAAFQAIRMSLLLMADNIEREITLSSQQRAAMRRLADATLDDMRGRLTGDFQQRAAEEYRVLTERLEDEAAPEPEAEGEL